MDCSFEISQQILARMSLVSLHTEVSTSVFLAPKRLIALLGGDTVFFFFYVLLLLHNVYTV